MQNVTGKAGAGTVATDETDRLIASNKVEGTAVYNRQGERRRNKSARPERPAVKKN